MLSLSVPSSAAMLSQGIAAYVEHVEVSGVTVLPAGDIDAIKAPFEHRLLVTEDVEALRMALTNLYVSHGYVSSGAVVPDQDLDAGVLRIEIIEGRLEGIEVTGNSALSARYLRTRILSDAEKPLNINSLQERLQLLLQDSLVASVNAEIIPSKERGRAKLRARIREKPPYRIDARFDNHVAPSLGGLRARIGATHFSALRQGDTAAYRFERAEGQSRHALSYEIPLTQDEVAVGAWIETADSRNVEAPFNTIDIESDYDAHGAYLEYPLVRSLRRTVVLSTAFERRNSRTYLLGMPFSFAPGVQDGGSEVSVVKFGQEWAERHGGIVVAARSEIQWGVDAFSPTVNERGPDARYFAWLGQAQIAKRFERFQLIWRTDVQVALDPLLPLNKFALGGANSVRGYRENQLVRDQGFLTSAEVRVPVFRGTRHPLRVDLATFIDIGGAWELASKVSDPGVIASAGVGVRAEYGRQIAVQCYWGHAFVSVADPGGDVQDDGVHFALSVNWPE